MELRTCVGTAFDRSALDHDVRALYATGRFADVRALSWKDEGGVHVRFDVDRAPRMMLGQVHVDPEGFAPKPKIPAGQAVDANAAQRIAREFQRRLEGDGYVDVHVSPELTRVGPSRMDLRLHVSEARRIRVGRVELKGDVDGIGARALRGSRPRWYRRPALSTAGIEVDRMRVVSAFVRRGYTDANVRAEPTVNDDGLASVSFSVRPGVRSTEVPDDVCERAWKMREEAEGIGVLDFSAYVAGGVVRAEMGPAYTLRRVDFTGNRVFSDITIRRNSLLEEGKPLDPGLLRRSLDRLNRSGMFEPLSAADVDIRTDASAGLADVRIRLRERKAGSWFLSGPVGPVSLAGPLRFTVSSRLPAWGQGLLELASVYGSLHFGPEGVVASVDRPFAPAVGWASGFSVAPQLGWRRMATQYGATQLRERLFPRLNGTSTAEEPMLVRVRRGSGEDAVAWCEAPPARLAWLRRSAWILAQAGSLLL